MKGLILFFIILFVFVFYRHRSSARVLKAPFPAKVVWVYDGDTIQVRARGRKYKVRFAGIDAPETKKIVRGRVKSYGQPFAKQAKVFLEKRVLRRNVRIEVYGVDQYQRLLAFVFLGEQNLNVALVREGLSEVYHRGTFGPYESELYKAERGARKEMKGVWSLGAGYESPRVFRKEGSNDR